MTHPFRQLTAVALACLCGGAAATPREDALRYAKCVAPQLRVSAIDLDDAPASYAVEAHGKRHQVAFERRASFELLDPVGNVVALVKVDRVGAAGLREQVRLRERWMADVADGSGAELDRREVAGTGFVLNLTRKELAGKYLGISLMVDDHTGTAVQWQWPRLARYASLAQFQAMQSAVWERLIPCAWTS